jgi:predicted transcriptional regulator
MLRIRIPLPEDIKRQQEEIKQLTKEIVKQQVKVFMTLTEVIDIINSIGEETQTNDKN